MSIFLEHPILLEKFGNQIIDIVKDPDVKEMLVSIQDMKVNNTFQLNKFLEIEGTKKDLFLKYSSEKTMYADVDSAKRTINSIISNIKEKTHESEYFSILRKFSDGVDLTYDEKAVLKNFKK